MIIINYTTDRIHMQFHFHFADLISINGNDENFIYQFILTEAGDISRFTGRFLKQWFKSRKNKSERKKQKTQ